MKRVTAASAGHQLKFDETFNRDIMANSDDPEILAATFPKLSSFLHWNELAEEFNTYNRAAATYKKRTIANGRIAVWSSFAAIAIVAIYPAVTNLISLLSIWSASEAVLQFMIYVELFFRFAWLPALAIGVIAASQSMFVKHRRQTWLKSRAYSERLRQLFFQHLIVWLPFMASSNSKDQETALRSRQACLYSLRGKYSPSAGGTLEEVMNDYNHEFWQVCKRPDIQPAPIGRIDPFLANEILTYIFDRRIEFQIKHAKKNLENSKSSSFVSPAFKLARHQRLLISLTAAFLVFQLIAGFLIFQSRIPELFFATGDASEISNSLIIMTTQAAAVFCAGLVVALKSIEDGLNLRGDVARYRTYAGLLRRIRNSIGEIETFDEKNLTLLQAKLLAAEELAYWEMREFISLQDDANFST